MQRSRIPGKTYTVEALKYKTDGQFDYVIMSAGGARGTFRPLFEENGAIVIDNSSHWRMHEGIDLIVLK